MFCDTQYFEKLKFNFIEHILYFQGSQCCVVRMEAVEGFVVAEVMKAAVKRMEEYRKESKKEEIAESTETFTEEEKLKAFDAKQKKEQEEKRNDYLKFQEFLILEQKEQKGKYVFNPNLYTNVPVTDVP